MKLKFVLLLFCFCIVHRLYAQTDSLKIHNDSWAYNQLKNMSLEEKIAQLVVMRVSYDANDQTDSQMVDLVQRYQPGGVCFFKGNPTREANLTNNLQEVSKIPLLVTIDGEWGPSMRLDSVLRFPRQMTLGALSERYDSLIYAMGKEIATQCKALGINVNFAPDIDVNNNPANPVINSRSFGEDKQKVTRKGLMYLSGMWANDVVGCAKHFPGHGDTDTDSHNDLPVIKKSKEKLMELELFPYFEFIKNEVPMIMVSPLNVPFLDTNPNSIALLSYDIITNLLRKEMHYQGIVITDGMEMNGLRKFYKGGGEAEVKALEAGNDILLLPDSLSIIIPAVKNAIAQGILTEQQIDEKCLKILQLKEQINLTFYTPISTADFYQKLNSQNAQDIVEQIECKVITLVKNDSLLPLKNASHTLLLSIGNAENAELYQPLADLYGMPFLCIDRSIPKSKYASLLAKMENCDKIIVAVQRTNQLPNRKYGVYDETVKFIEYLATKKQVILSIFGNPYILSRFSNYNRLPAVMVAYQESYNAFSATLDCIFGYKGFEGILPVTATPFPVGTGIITAPVKTPEPLVEISILPKKIESYIDSVAQSGIERKIYPGCQVLALHKGKTVFYKNYGCLTYEENDSVNMHTMYDVASITKAAATTLAVMRLYDEKKLALHDKLGKYFPDLSGTDKEDITIAELLTHTSGLVAFIPIYKNFSDPALAYQYLNDIYSPPFTVKIAQNLYMNSSYLPEIRNIIDNSTLRHKGYEYSDLNFYYLKLIVEVISGMPMDEYLNTYFYKPMGLQNTTFNPLNAHFCPEQIAPTENDTIFRHQVVRGYVHDQLAAMCGGVCGNAGLFTTAEELAHIFALLMNDGTYNGKRYISKETTKKFTHTYPIHSCLVRALGFHTPAYEKPSGLLPKIAGKHTFGHQGFTGTVVWCDPDNELIYIFLSNRVYPNTDPNLLSKSKIRLTLQKKIYEGIF